MNSAVNVSIQAITGKNSLSECSVNELRQIINTYPYFGPAHLLLTKKLKEENAAQYTEQLQKTALYFHNPLLLDLLMQTSPDTLPEQHIPITEHVVAEESISPEAPVKEEEIVVEKNEELVSHSISSLVSLPSFKIEPLKESNKGFAFQPYHTVDYFASQGIKMKEEPKADDKFGKQLKSFTEWLKTLKKLPDAGTSLVEATTTDQKVEQMAEKSISGENAVTEAMAEVWEKQGNKDKAIEIYTKLSLSDPAKSSYFAAKIEQLKNL